jgi:hypothetical protein
MIRNDGSHGKPCDQSDVFEDTYRVIPVSFPPKLECFVAYTQTYSGAGSFIIPALPSQIPPPL